MITGSVVLFIAYNFPPAGGAGVQRSLKFIKYLPSFGWRPVVITTTPDAYPVLDQSLWRDVPEKTPIYRVRSYDINGWRSRFERLKMGALLTALNVMLLLPDAALLWPRLARATVRKAVAEHHPQLIYSSSGPPSAHFLGLWAKKTFEIPWVADYRDPWSQSELTPYCPGYRAVNRWMERKVLRSADAIVTVSKPLADDLQRLSEQKSLSISIIENGYDPDDIHPYPHQVDSCFTISYTGTFSRLRRPDDFVAAVDELVAQDQIPREKLRVVFAGKHLDEYIPSRPPFELLGYVDHTQLAELRRQTDLFLFIQDDSRENRRAYSSKLFEYLGANRPILAIAPRDGVAAELITEARAGSIVPSAPRDIAKALLRYYQTWESRGFTHSPDWSVIHRYTRRNLTARLKTVFEGLLVKEHREYE